MAHTLMGHLALAPSVTETAIVALSVSQAPPDVWRHEKGERPGNRGSRRVGTCGTREAGLRFSTRNANSRREGRHPSLPNKFPLYRDRGRRVTALLVDLFACDRGLRRDKSGGQGANILRGRDATAPDPTRPRSERP